MGDFSKQIRAHEIEITVWKFPIRDMSYNCEVIVIVHKNDVNREITKKRNCCCLHQVVICGTQWIVRIMKNCN